MVLSESFRKLIPESIGPFHLVSEIGAGGHGVVFLAERRTPFTQRVAVKVLFPELSSYGNSSLDVSEAASLSQLKHSGIVGLLDSGVTASGLRYLVMEYVEGKALDAYCDECRLSIAQRIEILCGVLDALEYAHRRLVIHADLKPDNIRVTDDGRPRLLDFSTARLLPEARLKMLEESGTAGRFEISDHTPLYASPEQRRGERLTTASDIYSMGLIARLILWGIKPVPTDVPLWDRGDLAESQMTTAKLLGGSSREAVEKVARDRGTTPKSLRRFAGPDIDAIVERALRFNPADRYESAAEMRDDLERFRLGYPLRTRPVGRFARVYKWAQRNRLAAAFAGIFLVAVCLSVVGVAWRAADARRQRAIAEERLHELVRLTDALAGGLIGSVQGLQGAEAAEDELLKNAHETIRTLAREDGDPQLEAELARQFEKMARLELARGQENPAALVVATDDIHQAETLIDRLNQDEPEVSRLRRDNEALRRLKNGRDGD